jgi:hypothetical protein
VKVELSAEADAQVDKVEAWWRRNRLGAPDLFMTELAEALIALAEMPTLGVEYRAKTATVRRVLRRASPGSKFGPR